MKISLPSLQTSGLPAANEWFPDSQKTPTQEDYKDPMADYRRTSPTAERRYPSQSGSSLQVPPGSSRNTSSTGAAPPTDGPLRRRQPERASCLQAWRRRRSGQPCLQVLPCSISGAPRSSVLRRSTRGRPSPAPCPQRLHLLRRRSQPSLPRGEGEEARAVLQEGQEGQG